MQDGSSKSSNHGGGNNKDSNNNPEAVKCIVKFRPRSDWRGEYGFDWVREQNDPFYDVVGGVDDATGKKYSKKNDEGFYPMEYAYNAKKVFSIKYVKTKKGWMIRNYEHDDPINGSSILNANSSSGDSEKTSYTAAGNVNRSIWFNEAVPLYHYVDVGGGEKLSLQNDGGKYKAPIYEEFVTGYSGAQKISIDANEWDKVVCFTKGKYNGEIKYLCVRGRFFARVTIDKRDERSGSEISDICYWNGGFYKIRYQGGWRDNEYLDGVIDWVTDIWNDNQKEYNRYKNSVLNLVSDLGINEEMLKNNNVRIDTLCVNHSDWSSISVIVNKPKILNFYDYPFDNKVHSWKEKYINTFYPENILLEGQTKKRQYIIPVLSVGLLEEHRVIELTLRVTEGDPPQKLYFKDPKEVVRVGEDNTVVPNGKNTTTFNVNRLKNEPCETRVEVYDNKNFLGKPCGYLRIVIQKRNKLNVIFAQVALDSTLDDDTSSLIVFGKQKAYEILSQAGAVLVDHEYPLFLTSTQNAKVKTWLQSGCFVLDDSNQYDYLLNCLIEDLKNKKSQLFSILKHTIVIFALPNPLSGSFAKTPVTKTHVSKKVYGQIYLGKRNTNNSNKIDYLSTISHEILHVFGNPHSFQLKSTIGTNPFCLPQMTTSNVMDYSCILATDDDLNYSLHKYQWDKIISKLKSIYPNRTIDSVKNNIEEKWNQLTTPAPQKTSKRSSHHHHRSSKKK